MLGIYFDLHYTLSQLTCWYLLSSQGVKLVHITLVSHMRASCVNVHLIPTMCNCGAPIWIIMMKPFMLNRVWVPVVLHHGPSNR